jgi:hypothetical protein
MPLLLSLSELQIKLIPNYDEHDCTALISPSSLFY